MQNQVTLFTEKFLSPYLCGYRKGFRIQQALVSLIVRWKKMDQKGYGGAVLSSSQLFKQQISKNKN